MSDVLRQTDSKQTAETPDDRAAARDDRADAPAAAGPAPETASPTGASPVERPGGPGRESGDVIYGSGDMEETDEEDTDIHDADLERANVEAAHPGAADLGTADEEPAAGTEPSPEMETGGAYPGPDTETTASAYPGPDTETTAYSGPHVEATAGTQPGPGMETPAGAQPRADIPTAEGTQPDMESGTGSGMAPAGGLQAQPGAETVADTGLMADAAQVRQRWQEIQASFVDDPRESVERAAMLADEVLSNVMAAGQQRITDLRNAWYGDGTDTERLRNALRRYRMFIDRLAGI